MLGKGVMNLSGRNVKFFLAKPLTYMNESGNALASISAYYQIEPDHIVVIHDDMDLDLDVSKSRQAAPQADIMASSRLTAPWELRSMPVYAWALDTRSEVPTPTTTP